MATTSDQTTRLLQATAKGLGVKLSAEDVVALHECYESDDARTHYGIAVCFHHDLRQETIDEDGFSLLNPSIENRFMILKSWDPSLKCYVHSCPDEEQTRRHITYTVDNERNCIQFHPTPPFTPYPVVVCAMMISNQAVSIILCVASL